jgi:glycosyltransferase involved in cell wall biosynthesis
MPRPSGAMAGAYSSGKVCLLLMRVLAIAAGSSDQLRARRLCAPLGEAVSFFDIDKDVSRAWTFRRIRQALAEQPWDLIYQEGGAIAAGLNLIDQARRTGQRYIVSLGDPIGGYFHSKDGALAGAAFGLYEKLLYRHAAAFVGWTPYLTGASLKLGARRAITIEGGTDLSVFRQLDAAERQHSRSRFGLSSDHIVCGVVGSLLWTPRARYCYGLELIETLKLLHRPDVSLLIVGDGTGRAVLESRLPSNLKDRVVFTGRLPEQDVVAAINAMDIGFVTQTLDGLGSFRLTIKLPEYLACGVPVAMSPIPGFYDYVSEAGWPLPPFHPAQREFHERCAEWLDHLTADEIAARAQTARAIACDRFDYDRLSHKFCSFVRQIVRDSDLGSKR